MNYQSVSALPAEKSAENPDKEFIIVEDRLREIERMTYQEFEAILKRAWDA